MLLKKIILPSVAFVVLMAIFLTSCLKKDVNAEVKNLLIKHSDSLDHAVLELEKIAANGDTSLLRPTFLSVRTEYKKLEWFCEYYAPGLARELNGPPLPEMETEETKFSEPSGLQVIEELVYDEASTEELKREILSLKSSVSRLKSTINSTELTEARIFDACKQEVFRIIISGITGFDTPISYQGLTESSMALQSIQETMEFFGKNKLLKSNLEKAIAYLQKHRDFNSFDRMAFIKQYADPITNEMVYWEKGLQIDPLQVEQALRWDATSLFEKNAFNISHFAGSKEAMPTEEKTQLGEHLFSDPIVSGSLRTCESCHQPGRAFTDGLPKSASLTSGRSVKRNAPTLLYAGLQNAQFYDMRFQTLENQAMDVIANKDEMHGSVEDAAKRLEKDKDYYQLFKNAFPTMETELKPRFVMIALASYIRSLNPFNSRFDQYMRGDDKQMSQEELNGFNLFTGKAKCATCHFMPLFNGTAGPGFSTTEGEVLGAFENPLTKTTKIDSDEGRYVWTKIDQLKFAFKTPTLRNVALTAPYMHNGAYKTMEEVMDFYNNGGAAGVGLKLQNQTLSSDSLHLSKVEIREIISFLKTLSDQNNQSNVNTN